MKVSLLAGFVAFTVSCGGGGAATGAGGASSTSSASSSASTSVSSTAATSAISTSSTGTSASSTTHAASSSNASSTSTGMGTTCLASGTDADINAVFATHVPGAEAVLCPNAVFALGSSVALTAPNQKIYTESLPTDGSRATLRVTGPNLATAVVGHDLSGIALKNVQVDGNRPALGRIMNGGALIEIGGNSTGQVVDHIASFEPRGWSALHVFEGSVTNDVPGCQGASITNSTFGPSGTFDGTMSGTWADGISYACGNGLIDGNTITDATDGGIVIFGAPGSTVRNNTVVAKTRHLFGGINMVDYAPVHGNYAGTSVHDNVVDGEGHFIEIAIAMGPPIWSCNANINAGGSVTNNTVKGHNVGYGYAVNNVSGWTAQGNVDTARHVGAIVSQCGATPSAPAAFQSENVGAGSSLQTEFQSASLTGLVWAVSEPAILRAATSPTACGTMTGSQGLYSGDSVMSCDGRFQLTLQAGGDLVLMMGTTQLWHSNTAGKRSALAIVQGDGNFVVYDATGTAIWSSNTPNNAGAHLDIQNDGNLVLYSASSASLWASNTCCH